MAVSGQSATAHLLQAEGFAVGRKHVATSCAAGHYGAVRKTKTSTPGMGSTHRIYPYLSSIRDRRPNQVWDTDITYIPMAKGSSTWRRSDWTGRVAGCSLAPVHTLTTASVRGDPGGAREVRDARDLQHRSGRAVHQRRVHEGARIPRHPHQLDGRGRWAITSLSSGSAAASNTRRSTCMPTVRSLRRKRAWASTLTSTTASARIRAWNVSPPMPSTSASQRTRRRHDEGESRLPPSWACDRARRVCASTPRQRVRVRYHASRTRSAHPGKEFTVRPLFGARSHSEA